MGALMNNDEEEMQKLREKKLKEALSRFQEQAEIERQMTMIANKYLEPRAYERLMNVKLSNPKLYQKVISILATYGNRMKRKLTDKELLSLLKELLPRRETRIYIKRKGDIYGKHKK